MSRSLLHKEKLEEFKAWLDTEEVYHRPGKGHYQVLQVKIGDDWLGVYSRNEMPEHYSTDIRLDSTVAQFCEQRKAAASNTQVQASKRESDLLKTLKSQADVIEEYRQQIEHWEYLASALYQACGAYDMPERVLDALSAAQGGEPFNHLIDDILPCYPEPISITTAPTYQVWRSTDSCQEFYSWDDVDKYEYDQETEPTKKRKFYLGKIQ